MNKEKNLQDREVVMKRSTALLIAVLCLAAGFLAGMFYSTTFSGGRKVRKMTVKQSTPQAGVPRAGAPVTTPPQSGVISALEKNVAANPRDAEAWARLGHGYFDINDPANAIRAYKKSLELKPDNANVLTDMGVMYRRSGRPDEAIRCFDKAIEIDPQHRQSRYNKGIVLMHDLENPGAAIKAWEELINLYPDAKTQDGTPLKELIEKFRSSSPTEK
ncbi:MAG: tetratricopeptide repeat protein [Candidatus Aminicenantes bacterium]|nr:MAG: tetratricopeptide repeat protein [Candidatus Aminicenantes bacterium]